MTQVVLLCAVALSISGTLAQVNVPPRFEVGVKWQIVIQNTIDPNGALQPTDALVWDLDLHHVSRNPGIIDYLRSNIPDVTLICYFNAGLAKTSDCNYETK